MKNMRKVWAIALVILMAVTLFPMAALAAEVPTEAPEQAEAAVEQPQDVPPPEQADEVLVEVAEEDIEIVETEATEAGQEPVAVMSANEFDIADDSVKFSWDSATGKWQCEQAGVPASPTLIDDNRTDNPFIIKQTSPATPTKNTITVDGMGSNARILYLQFSGINIKPDDDISPVEIKNGGYADIQLNGENTVDSRGQLDNKGDPIDQFRVSAAIRVEQGNALYINAKSGLSDKLTAIGFGGAGIGGNGNPNGDGAKCGTVKIYGGTIEVTSLAGAGIGGGNAGGVDNSVFKGGDGGTVEINGGKVALTAKHSGAAIGGGGAHPQDISYSNYAGYGGNGGNVQINGGEVVISTAGGVGIGGGAGIGDKVTIGGAGGNLTINDGKVIITGTDSGGAAIGGGLGRAENATGGAGGNVTINGGELKIDCESSVGIGGGQANGSSLTAGRARGGAGGNVTINGGKVNVISRNYTGSTGKDTHFTPTAIGGGTARDAIESYGGDGGSVTVNGGELTATAVNTYVKNLPADKDGIVGAGIGGGIAYKTSGTVTATGGGGATVKINAGTVKARSIKVDTGTKQSAGIGGGCGETTNGGSGSIVITGGSVTYDGANGGMQAQPTNNSSQPIYKTTLKLNPAVANAPVTAGIIGNTFLTDRVDRAEYIIKDVKTDNGIKYDAVTENADIGKLYFWLPQSAARNAEIVAQNKAYEHSAVVTLTDNSPAFDITQFTPNVPSISTTVLKNGKVGVGYEETLTATARTYEWSVSNGALPPGLNLDLRTGKISGTPTREGNFEFKVTAKNILLQGVEKDFNITVEPPPPSVIYHKLTYKYMDGVTADKTEQIMAGAKAKAPAEPTRKNHKFAGWYTDSGFAKKYDFDDQIYADVTLYAKWLPKVDERKSNAPQRLRSNGQADAYVGQSGKRTKLHSAQRRGNGNSQDQRNGHRAEGAKNRQ